MFKGGKWREKFTLEFENLYDRNIFSCYKSMKREILINEKVSQLKSNNIKCIVDYTYTKVSIRSVCAEG